MESEPTSVLVVAACIRDGSGRILLQQALPGKRHAGMWEFPGGKVESEETPRFALRREVAEELGLQLFPGSMVPAGFAEEAACEGRPSIVLLLYNCLTWSGEPEAREGQRWGWFALPEALSLALGAMDRPLLEALDRRLAANDGR